MIELSMRETKIRRFNFASELSQTSVKSNGVKCLSFEKAEKQMPNYHVSFQIGLISSSSTEGDDLVDSHVWDAVTVVQL